MNGVYLSNFTAGRFQAGFLKLRSATTTAASCFRCPCRGRRALPQLRAKAGHAVCPCHGDDKGASGGASQRCGGSLVKMQHAELQPQRALLHLLGFSKPGPHFRAKPHSMQCRGNICNLCTERLCQHHCHRPTSGIAFTKAANASTKLLSLGHGRPPATLS